MDFFDYVYYKSCKFYAKTDEEGSGISGLAVIALMEGFNIFTIFILVCLFLQKKFHLGKLSMIVFAILLLIANGIRYNKLNYGVLKERWDNEDENIRGRKGRLVVLYIIGSAILCVGLAIYIGSKKW
jgi:formate hydrogenlyase subunit 3/multisubunit Na+/H+ antiporter MnhD subunit